MAKKVRLERFDQTDILNDLRAFGKYVTVWKNMVTSENNIPDIVFTSCLTGPVVVELKKSDEDVKGGQMTKLIKLNSTGMDAYAVSGKKGYLKLRKHLNMTMEILAAAHESYNKRYGGNWEDEITFK